MDRYPELQRIAREACAGADSAHDFQHVLRVAANAELIARAEQVAVDVVVPAALLHELFNYPKNHPDSARSGEVCAERALIVLRDQGWAADVAERVAACIRVHGFSRGIVPDNREAMVLQDADRLDAIGAIGIARCFATGAVMRQPFYEPVDPFCARREPDDKQWSVDHFYRKLLHLPARMHTATARTMAEERGRYMDGFLAQLGREIEGGAA
jgi:uncharacterized protein